MAGVRPLFGEGDREGKKRGGKDLGRGKRTCRPEQADRRPGRGGQKGVQDPIGDWGGEGKGRRGGLGGGNYKRGRSPDLASKTKK